MNTHAGEANPQNVAHQLVDAYYKQPDRNLLSQGDIISLEKLRKNFVEKFEFDLGKELYPYFFTNYSYGIVLNADCDIFVKDGRRAKVRCAQIAAVVEASDFIKNLLMKVSSEDHYLTRLIDEKTYFAVVRKFERLINNQEKLYFYLPENQNIGFRSAHLVRLDTSVSIQVSDEDRDRAKKKYDAVVASRLAATLEEPYKSKLGENFASLFDRTGLTDAKDHLNEDYDSWIKQEMLKYFFAVDDAVYRRASAEAKELALKLGPQTPEYAQQLGDLLAKYAKQGEETFDDLPIVQSMKRIIEGRVKATVAPEIIKNLMNDPHIRRALQTLATPTVAATQDDD